MGKNAHEEINKIKAEYLAAYAARWGEAAANRLSISYRAGWFFLTSSPLKPPPPGERDAQSYEKSV